MLFYRPSGRHLYKRILRHVNKTMTIAEANYIFTREDLSSAQQMVGHIAADFMRTEVLPLVDRIYAKDWSLTRELLLKAGELDLLRVDIPEAYGGLGLDKVSSAYVGEQ